MGTAEPMAGLKVTVKSDWRDPSSGRPRWEDFEATTDEEGRYMLLLCGVPGASLNTLRVTPEGLESVRREFEAQEGEVVFLELWLG
jgi:hypothetical protein